MDLDYLQMPREMTTFEMPQVPENVDGRNMAAACALLDEFLDSLARARAGNGGYPRIDLLAAPPAAVEILNESLGEGEVAIRIAGHEDIRIQETVFAGVWRERHFAADGTLRGDILEASPIPAIATETARRGSIGAPLPVDLPPGAMNAPALLHEIAAQVRALRPGAPPHVLNLTLLPLTPDDHRCLDAALPVGPVAILSRGFGNCRITSTAVRDVWRVQYFNNMQTLILNTLEIVGIPEVALAADEDLADSAERLRDLREWMGESTEA
jgi:hydrogenase-1 operon protein HyaF